MDILGSKSPPSGNSINSGSSIHSTISRDSTQSVLVQQQLVLESPARLQSKPPKGQTSEGSSEFPGQTSERSSGNHALQDYQMQLMLLEQQNKKRLLMARMEQDELSALAENNRVYTHEGLGAIGQKRPHPVVEGHDQDRGETYVSVIPRKRRQLSNTARTPSPIGATRNEQEASDTMGLSGKMMDNHVSIAQTHSSPSIVSLETKVDAADEQVSMHPKSPSPLGISTGTTRNGSGDFASEYTPSKDKRNNTTTFCVAYRISCESSERHNGSMFVDPPQWSDEWSFLGKAELRLSNRLHLVGNVPIKNMHAWLNSLGGVAFIVFRDYRCRDSLSWNTLRGADSGTTAPICREESIAIISEGLQTAINTVAKCSPSDSAYAPSRKPNEYAIPKNQDKEKDEELHHRFLYHHRHALLQYAETEDLEVSNQIIELLKYLEISKGSIYEEADTLFAQGEVKKHHIELLFCPNDIIISTLNGLPIACVLREWPAGQCTIFLECWYWGFDGSWLHRRPITLSIRRPPDAKVKIRQLEAYPIKYATQVDIDHLLARGQKWWNLRYQTLVSYKGWDYEAQKFYNYETRCMIDYQTYRSFHPRADTFTFSTKNRVLFDKWSTSIPHNGALSKVDFLLLPPDIHGYPLKEKKWSRLLVDNVFDVTWNKDAFERLVLPSKTKELIKASVMVRTLVPGKSQGMSLAGKRDDLIAGKGNGLIMLLHGGPGTGKTLTAESVAEIAEMPLYNVTCGDIGTKPDDVETYLQGVLALGKTWNCVLLLDEADVFLEERTLSDLDRNSLVSVFLRTLEYYEGILILTSNRVGTFDEAFKSRIQVALHYPTLDRISQKKIWQNFFDMLRIDEEDVNLDELSRHMDELADQEMNGRQIRNALTTARQLALFKKQTLDWEHLEQAIKTARDFNRYLKGVHGHTDEQWAREQKMR